MKSKQKGIVLRSRFCDLHQAYPMLIVNNDRFTIRCCCNFLTQKYISQLENKLKGINFETILNEWENDLLINELQLNKISKKGQAINMMLTTNKKTEQ
jgi:hypothetical protein